LNDASNCAIGKCNITQIFVYRDFRGYRLEVIEGGSGRGGLSGSESGNVSPWIAGSRCAELTHYAGLSCVITRQHETNRRIRYYRVLRKRSTDGRYQDERMNELTDERTNGRTDGRTNRQLAREPSEPKGARERAAESWGARPRKGLASCNYGASATPALSPIIRVRFEVRFSGPLGGQSPRESHREASRPKRLYKPRRYGARKEERRCRETGAPQRSIMWRLPSDTDRFHRFGAVSGLHAFSCDHKNRTIETVACLAATIAESRNMVFLYAISEYLN